MDNPFHTQLSLRPEPAVPRGRWRRRLFLGSLGTVGLLLALYFFFTSAFFFRGVILPRIGKALNAKVRAGEIDFSLFGDLRLGDLEIRTTGQQPLLTSKEVKLEAGWWSFLCGKRRLEAVYARGTLVHVVENPKGSSNLDPVLKALGQSKGGDKGGLHNLRLDQFTLRHSREGKATELALDWFTLDHWAPNAVGTAQLTGSGALRKGRDQLSMDLAANAVFGLDAEGRPHTLNLNGQAQARQATGAYKHAEQLSAILHGELTPTALKTFSIDFTQADRPLGRIAANGSLDMAQGEGQLNCVLQSIDRRVLNILGASRGLDFGGTVVNATNQVTIAERQWAVSGPFYARNFSVTRDGRTTPLLELSAHVDAELDLDARMLKLETLNILGMRQRQRLLAASLSAPMHLSWGDKGANPSNARLQMDIYNANLSEWQPFIGRYAKAGMLTAGLTLRYSGDSKRLAFGVGMTGLGIQPAVRGLPEANLSLQAQGLVENLRTMSLDHYRLQLTDGTRELVLATGQSELDLRERWLDTTTELRVFLPWMAVLLKQPSFTATAGHAEFKGRFACLLDKGRPVRPELLHGRLGLTNFQGTVSKRTLRDVSASWETEVVLKDRRVGTVGESTVHLNAGGQSAGTLTLHADFDAQAKTVKVAFNGSRLNQELVRPWLPSLPGGMSLLAASVEARGSLEMGAGGMLSFNGDVAANGVRLADSDGQLKRAGMSFLVAAKGETSRTAQGAWDWTLTSLNGRAVRGAVAAGGFNASGGHDAAKGEGNLGFAIQDMDAAAWSPFLNSWLQGWRLEGGQVKGTGTANWTMAGRVVKARVNLENSRWRDPRGAPLPHLMSAGLELTLDPLKAGAGWPWAVKGEVKSGDEICGTMDLSGTYNDVNRTGRFGGAITNLNERLAGPLLAGRLGKNRLMYGRFSLTGGGVIGTNGLSEVKGTVRFAGLKVLDESGLLLELPQSGWLKLDGEVKQNIWTLRQAELALTVTAESENVVNLTGTLDRSRPGELGGKLKLTAGSLDFGPMAGWLTAWPRTPGGQSTRWRDLELDCSVRRVILFPSTVSNLVSHVKLDGPEVWLKGMRALVNGAPVELDAAWKLSGASPFLAGVVRADAVPVGPMVDVFRPDLKGQITGKLNLNARFQGSGTNMTALIANLDGNATMSLSDARIRSARDQANRSGMGHWIGKVEEVTQKILELNMVISRLPQANPLDSLLKKLPLYPRGRRKDSQGLITRMEMSLVAGQGQMNNKLEWQTAEYRAESRGVLLLTKGWPPPIEQPVSIFLPAAQAKVLGLSIPLVKEVLPGRNKETRLPHDFISISGNVLRPKMDFSKKKLMLNFPADFFSKLPLLKLLFSD